jgi:hypothetical protein
MPGPKGAVEPVKKKITHFGHNIFPSASFQIHNPSSYHPTLYSSIQFHNKNDKFFKHTVLYPTRAETTEAERTDAGQCGAVNTE